MKYFLHSDFAAVSFNDERVPSWDIRTEESESGPIVYHVLVADMKIATFNLAEDADEYLQFLVHTVRDVSDCVDECSLDVTSTKLASWKAAKLLEDSDGS